MEEKIEFYKEKEFKDTEIGRIPKDWEIKNLQEIMHIFDSKRVPIDENKRALMKGPFPYCGANGIIDYINYFIFDGEYILLAEDGGYWGKFEKSSYIMSGKFWVNNHAHILKISDKTHGSNYFYMYYFNYVDLSKYISGTTRGKLTQGTIRLIKLPFPPFEEQKKIAEILSTVDESIQKTDYIIAKTEGLKKGLMQELLTKGIGHKEFKDTEIGRIPKDWEVLELGDEKITVFIKSGNTPSKEIQEYWNGDILFVTQRDMTKVSKYLYETSEKITELGLKNFNLFIIPENSILLSMYGTIGKVVINKNPVTVSQNIAAIKLNNKNVNQEYFFYAIRYYSFQFKKKAKTSTMNHLNIKIVKQIYLPLPSLQEQQKIALVFSNIDSKISIEEDRRKYFEALFKTMLNKLMTGQIRVKNLEMREND